MFEFTKFDIRPCELTFFQDKNLTCQQLEIVSRQLSDHLRQLWSSKNYEQMYKKYIARFKYHGLGYCFITELSETSYLLQNFFRLPKQNRQLLEAELYDSLFDSLATKVWFILNHFTFYNRQLAYTLLNALLSITCLFDGKFILSVNISSWLKQVHEKLLEDDINILNFPLLSEPENIIVRKISVSEKLLMTIESKVEEQRAIISRLENLDNKYS